MTIGLIGKKCGMTRIFDTDGVSIPVTVVEVEPNRITQVKTAGTDGYRAIQITTGTRRASRVNKPKAGHFAKAKTEPGRNLWEFRLAESDKDTIGDVTLELGAALLASHVFTEGQVVDVTSISKGKGFAGVVKRYNFKTQDASHGNSLSHRAPGSIGQNQSPGRVFKGKKMAGQMGNKRVTVQNQKIVKIDGDRNLVLIKGVVPGSIGGDVCIKAACKVKTTKGEK